MLIKRDEIEQIADLLHQHWNKLVIDFRNKLWEYWCVCKWGDDGVWVSLEDAETIVSILELGSPYLDRWKQIRDQIKQRTEELNAPNHSDTK